MRPGTFPPRWIKQLLEFIIRPDVKDEIIGDIYEAYLWRQSEEGTWRAKANFFYETFRSLNPVNLRPFYHISINSMILRDHLKVAFRLMVKKRATSFINILGLSTGVAAFVLIFLYTYEILTFDDHHQNKDRIFLAYKERITPNGTQAAYDTWFPMKDRLKSEYSQVAEATRYFGTRAQVIKSEQFVEEQMAFIDESFFKVFNFPVEHGGGASFFASRNSIVISKEMAYKYFNKGNAVGELLEMYIPFQDTTMTFEVSAVLAPFPANVRPQPHLTIQIESIPDYPQYANEWGNSFIETYVLLNQTVDAGQLEASFPDLVEAIWGSGNAR